MLDYFFPHKRNGYHPHLFRKASVTAFVAVVLVLELGYITQITFVFPNTHLLASILPGVLTDLTNDTRATKDLSPIARNQLLDVAAQAAAEDMAAKGYFAHVSPDGKTPWYWLREAGYQYSYAGENLAVNFTDSQEVQTAWLNSPTHYANIIKPQYTEVGYGIANGTYEGRATTFVVEFFATPAPVVATTPSHPAPIATTPPTPTPTTPVANTPHILGTEAAVSGVPALGTNAPLHTSSIFAWMLTSPTSTVEMILSFSALIVALLFAIALIRKGERVKHANLIAGGALLLLVFSGSLLFDSMYADKVGLPQDSLSASVGNALP